LDQFDASITRDALSEHDGSVEHVVADGTFLLWLLEARDAKRTAAQTKRRNIGDPLNRPREHQVPMGPPVRRTD
jgi:hypothetical protein